MHDPSTVAFDIRLPFVGHKLGNGKRLGYALITIWHVDPERNASERGLRGDDSCGWFDVPTTPAERRKIRYLAETEFSTIFRRRWATIERKDYAPVCFEPTAHEAIHAIWRQIDRALTGRWRRPSKRDEEIIFDLAANPVDNLRSVWARVNSPETCAVLFACVHRAYLRSRRPWWKHPRWHFWHWSFQIHPWQQLRRRLFDRCVECGKPFVGESPISTKWHSDPTPWFGSAPDLHHARCMRPAPMRVVDPLNMSST